MNTHGSPYRRLRKLREAAGLDLFEVAQHARISESYLSKVERGRVPRIKNQQKHRRVVALEQWLRKQILLNGAQE